MLGPCVDPRLSRGRAPGTAHQRFTRVVRAGQADSTMVDDSELGHLMRAHLFSQPEPPDASDTCQAFGQLSPAELTPSQRACVDSAGDARWGARGPEGVNGSETCGRRWYGTRDVRCLLRGKDVLFVGNSVVRRQVRTAGHASRPPTRRRSAHVPQMYTLLDLLAGPRAHRQLRNFTSVSIPTFTDKEALKRSWIWDQASAAIATAHGHHRCPGPPNCVGQRLPLRRTTLRSATTRRSCSRSISRREITSSHCRIRNCAASPERTLRSISAA